MANADLVLQLKAVKGNTDKVLNDLIKKLSEAGKSGEKAGSKISEGISKGFDKAGKAIGSAVKKWGSMLGIAGITGVFYKALSAAKEFETGMSEVSTLLGKEAPAQMKKYDKAIKDLASRSSSTAAELSKGLYQVISAGTKGTETAAGSMKLLETAQKAAVAGVSNVFSSVDVLTTALNAYQQSADKATEFSDMLFTTVRLGKLTFNDLAAGLGTVASAAAGAGISFGEVNAALAAMTAGGVPPARAITALNAIIRVAAKGSKELDKAFGETTSNILEKKGLLGVMEALEKATGGSTIKLQKLGVEQEAVTGLAVLAGSGIDKFRSALVEMGNSAGATETAYQKMAKTFGEQTKTFWNKLNVILIEIGTELMPTILRAMNDFGDWVANNKDDIIKTFTNIWKLIVEFGGYILKYGDTIAIAFAGIWIAALGPLGKIVALMGIIIRSWGVVVKAIAEGSDVLDSAAMRAAKRLQFLQGQADIAYMKTSKLWGPMLRDLGLISGAGSSISAGIASGLYNVAVGMGPQQPPTGKTEEEKGSDKEREAANKKWLADRKAALNALFALEIANADELQKLRMKYEEDLKKLEKMAWKDENEKDYATHLRDKQYYTELLALEDKIAKKKREGIKQASKALEDMLVKPWADLYGKALSAVQKAFESRWDAIINKARNDTELLMRQISGKGLAGYTRGKIGGAELETEAERKEYAKYEIGPEEEGPGMLSQVATGFMESAGSMLFNWAGTLVTTLAGGKEAVQGLVDGAIEFWESLADNLDDALIYLAEEGIPKIIDSVISSLPRITTVIIKNIPAIVAAIAKAVYEALSDILSLGIEGKGGEMLGGTLSGAGMGAAVGSIIPGVGTAIGAGVGAAVGFIASLFHEGGFVDTLGKNTEMFQNAIKAHSGMFVQPRLASNEVPAILEAGEGIIRKEVMAAIGGRAGIDAINAGQSVGGTTIVNNNLNVNHMLSEDTPKVLDRMSSDNYRKGIGRMSDIINGSRVAGLETAR